MIIHSTIQFANYQKNWWTILKIWNLLFGWYKIFLIKELFLFLHFFSAFQLTNAHQEGEGRQLPLFRLTLRSQTIANRILRRWKSLWRVENFQDVVMRELILLRDLILSCVIRINAGMYSLPSGVFLFMGYSKTDEQAMHHFTNLNVSKHLLTAIQRVLQQSETFVDPVRFVPYLIILFSSYLFFLIHIYVCIFVFNLSLSCHNFSETFCFIVSQWLISFMVWKVLITTNRPIEMSRN